MTASINAMYVGLAPNKHLRQALLFSVQPQKKCNLPCSLISKTLKGFATGLQTQLKQPQRLVSAQANSPCSHYLLKSLHLLARGRMPALS